MLSGCADTAPGEPAAMDRPGGPGVATPLPPGPDASVTPASAPPIEALCQTRISEIWWRADASNALFPNEGELEIPIAETTLVWGLQAWLEDNGAAALEVDVTSPDGSSLVALRFPDPAFIEAFNWSSPRPGTNLLRWSSEGALRWGLTHWGIECEGEKGLATQWRFESTPGDPDVVCRSLPRNDRVLDWTSTPATDGPTSTVAFDIPVNGIQATAFPRVGTQAGAWFVNVSAEDGTREMEFQSVEGEAGAINTPVGVAMPRPFVLTRPMPLPGAHTFVSTAAGHMENLVFPLFVLHCP